jgi:prevent-host-death family protein
MGHGRKPAAVTTAIAAVSPVTAAARRGSAAMRTPSPSAETVDAPQKRPYPAGILAIVSSIVPPLPVRRTECTETKLHAKRTICTEWSAVVKEVSVTQARADLSNLVNEVAYSHERVILTRHGKPLAVLVSAEDAKLLDAAVAAPGHHPLQIVDTAGSHRHFGAAAGYQGPPTLG